MNRSILLLLTLPFAIALGCSSTNTDDDETPSTSDEELRASNACRSKSCGESCRLCPPGASNCFETAVIKQCNAKGKCSDKAPLCGGGALDAGPAPYNPCAGKSCGAGCTLCRPEDPNCFETAVPKQCNAEGTCSDKAPACGGGVTDAGPAPYDPCAGKSAGERCSLCAPGNMFCFEPAVVLVCNAAGKCTL